MLAPVKEQLFVFNGDSRVERSQNRKLVFSKYLVYHAATLVAIEAGAASRLLLDTVHRRSGHPSSG